MCPFTMINTWWTIKPLDASRGNNYAKYSGVGGNGRWENKIKLIFMDEKNLKRRKLHKNGLKGFNIASFLVAEGGGVVIELHNIYPYTYFRCDFVEEGSRRITRWSNIHVTSVITRPPRRTFWNIIRYVKINILRHRF